MNEKNKKLENIGTTISCIGGLLVILNLSTWKGSVWELEIAILATALALIGLLIIGKAKKDEAGE